MGKQLSHEDFIIKFNELPNSEDYEIRSKYTKSRDKVKFFHKKCEKEFEMKANNFTNGQRCPYCYGRKIYTEEEFAKRIKVLTNGEYILKSEYINSHTKVRILHKKCKQIFDAYPNTFIQGSRCSFCSGNKKLTIDKVKENVLKISNGDYSIQSGSYKNVHGLLEFIHNECGNTFEMNYNNFRNGQRCPHCCNLRNSKAVKNISKYLKALDFQYKKEVTLEGLVNPKTEKKLRIDFFIPEINLYIEYDGKQHLKFSKKGIFTEEKFRELKLRDKIKDDYFKKHKLTLLRIKYPEKELDVLENYLLKNNWIE